MQSQRNGKRYLGHRFKYYLNNNRPFKVPMQTKVHILRHRLLLYVAKSILHFAHMAQFWLMHVYTN